MKKLTLLLLLIGTFLFTQNIAAQRDYAPGKLTWGLEHKSPGNSRMAKIIGTNKKGFYSLRIGAPSVFNGYSTYLIEQFNKKNKVVKSKELDMKYKKKRRDFENIMLLGDKLFLFTSFYNAGKKTKFLFAETLSSGTLKQRNDLQMIGMIEDKKQKRGVFDFVVAEDSTKVMVYHTLPYKKNQAEKFSFIVYDNEFQELWKKEVTLPYNDDAFEIKDYRVDNEGNSYILGKIYEDRPLIGGGRRSRPYYRYTILSYKDKGETFKEYHVELQDKFITDLTLKISDDGDLICAGFFSEQNENNQKGTCFIKIDKETNDVIMSNFKEFDFEFLTENYTDFQKSRAERAERNDKTNRKAELISFSLDELILRSDGGAVLVAEQFFVEEQNFNSFDRFDNRINYDFNYNDIIVVNINPDGTIEWTSRIPKRQETTNDNGYFSSYSMAVVRDRMYFVYNDNSRNFGEQGKFRRQPHAFNGSNSIIVLSAIDKNGKVKRYPLGSNRDEKIITRPKVCEQTGLYEMVIFGERRGKFRFGSLKFDPQ